MRNACAAAWGVAWLAIISKAQAEPLPLELDWQAPSECSSSERIHRELVRITKPRPGRKLAPLVARALIIRRDAGYHLTLETERNGETSTAAVDNPTCEPLSRAATLMLALAYGDGVDIRESDELESATAPTESSLAPPTTTSTPRATARGSQQPRLSVEVTPWVAGTASSGLVAALAFGTEAGLQIGARHWLTSLRARALPPVSAAREGAVSAQLSNVSAALGGCRVAALGPLRAAACFRAEAGMLRAHSAGARVNGAAHPAWFALVPSLLFQLPLTAPFTLRAEMGAVVPFTPARFQIAGRGTLYSTASVVPELVIGFEVAL